MPGGPWITANSLVSASCKALNCESSNFRSSAAGQEAGSNTETNSPAWLPRNCNSKEELRVGVTISYASTAGLRQHLTQPVFDHTTVTNIFLGIERVCGSQPCRDRQVRFEIELHKYDIIYKERDSYDICETNFNTQKETRN